MKTLCNAWFSTSLNRNIEWIPGNGIVVIVTYLRFRFIYRVTVFLERQTVRLLGQESASEGGPKTDPTLVIHPHWLTCDPSSRTAATTTAATATARRKK